MEITWKDVLDWKKSGKIDAARLAAVNLEYKYFSFNGHVYRTTGGQVLCSADEIPVLEPDWVLAEFALSAIRAQEYSGLIGATRLLLEAAEVLKSRYGGDNNNLYDDPIIRTIVRRIAFLTNVSGKAPDGLIDECRKIFGSLDENQFDFRKDFY